MQTHHHHQADETHEPEQLKDERSTTFSLDDVSFGALVRQDSLGLVLKGKCKGQSVTLQLLDISFEAENSLPKRICRLSHQARMLC